MSFRENGDAMIVTTEKSGVHLIRHLEIVRLRASSRESFFTALTKI